MIQPLLDEALQKCLSLSANGKVASYIPALANADPRAFGACIIDVNGRQAAGGDYQSPFTIQSISKVLSFICSLQDSPHEKIFQKISVEPTASTFNSIANLEITNSNKPLNPMINAGAIACLDFVAGNTSQEKFLRILEFTRLLSGNPDIQYNEAAYNSEMETGDRNRSLAYYMKSTGIISGSVDTLLDAYFRICSMEVTCIDLAKIGMVLAHDGRSATGEVLFPAHIARMVRTVMALCGMYNESGRYAVRVGVPSKSGVGGGIMAVAPGKKMGIGIFGPALTEYGSSVCGIALMEELSSQLSLSVF